VAELDLLPEKGFRMIVRLLRATALVLVFVTALAGHTAEPTKAKPESKVVRLWTDKAPGAMGDEDRDRPTLTIHLPDPSKATGTGVIVCPGGGYTILVADHEGQQVAKWLNSVGIAAFVLKYRLTPRYQRADALVDGKRAIRYVREHAKEFGISPKRVGIMGFSAGAHLSACTGIDFDAGNAQSSDPVEHQSSRPDFMVLVYGSTTTVSDPAKKDDPGKTFTAKTPPTFLFSTDGDGATNGLLACYSALRKVGVSAELHVFGGYGPHGTGLGAGDPAIGAWPKQLHAWLRKSGLLTTVERQAISGQILIDGKPLNRGWITLVPIDSPNKPVACCYMNHRQEGKVVLAAADGPCVGPHRIEVRQLALEQVGTPTLEDAVLFTKATKDAKEEMRYEVKPGENQLKVEIRTK
jgi:acetyl esterase/lipase